MTIRKNRPKVQNSKVFTTILDWIETIWSAVLLASVIMYFVIQAFKIPSGSMRMTLLEGDHLFVNKFIYGIRIPFTGGKKILPLRKVHRGDIVIFDCPPQALSPEEREKGIKKDFIKRAIGLPGDVVRIKNKKVYVNDEEIIEPYLNFESDYVQPEIKLFNSQEEYQKSWELGRFVNLAVRDNFGPVKVPEKHYIVLGDNRDKSFDSRFWGPLHEKYLKGQALVTYWPITRIKIIK
ncbi:MAG: signal peptidase I [Elusimicrobiota bacterium]|nr:signal peptidase I [Elusimicrobiota bacterium]